MKKITNIGSRQNSNNIDDSKNTSNNMSNNINNNMNTNMNNNKNIDNNNIYSNNKISSHDTNTDRLTNKLHYELNNQSKNQSKINSIIKKVKSITKPSIKILSEVDVVVDKINSIIRKNSLNADCVKGGSIAKGTFIKNDHDVDLFVRFSLNYESLSDMLEQLLKEAFPRVNIKRVHGSRDYFQFKIKSLDYEIVPVYRIHRSNIHLAQNITDFTPMHVEWVKQKTINRPDLLDEIRVAKLFCKANEVYGAESYIRGFSGHIIDILVIYYGSFLSLIKKFATISLKQKDNTITLERPIVIDPNKSLTDPINQLNKSKITPLIVIDPVQPDRNAAAALSEEKLLRFIFACRKFLSNPSIDFFKIKKFNINKRKSFLKSKFKNSKVIVLKINPLDGSKDVVGTKIYKVYEWLVSKLKDNCFEIITTEWHFDYVKKVAYFIFVMPVNKLSETYEHEGPPISSVVDVKRFKMKHPITKIKGYRIYAILKRKHVVPESLLNELLSNPYLTSRLKSIKILSKYENKTK
ncbi:MAG: CCA-adding protein [Candidatus Woesearchaeota archaeon]|nr:MAG: CCA-adding protein [Candidatus Woesearchaeota archaeon]